MNDDFKKKLELMESMGMKEIVIWTNLLFEVLFENLPDHVIQTLMQKHCEKITKRLKDASGDGE